MVQVRHVRCLAVLFAAACFCGSSSLAPARGADAAEPAPVRVPVIFDTDIGDDIDDTWALALLLRCPELDVKLVVGDYGKPRYRARLLARMLETAGRVDIPIGVGVDVTVSNPDIETQAEWIEGYELSDWPGKLYEDGVQAIIETVMSAPGPVTLIAVGPLPNIAAALRREPRIAQKIRFVGMHGSVRRGYDGSPEPAAEWNVVCDIPSCQQVFAAPWPMTVTPLDTCGIVRLSGEPYARIRESSDPLAQMVVSNFRIWSRQRPDQSAELQSSILFDTVAVYLATSQELCVMEELGLRVTDRGYTVIDETAKRVQVATAWKDLNRFHNFLMTRLTSTERATR